MATETETATQEAAEEALELLKPHSADIPAPLLAQLSSLAGNGEPEDDDDDSPIERAMRELQDAERAIAKSEDGRATREALHKARRTVEARYLAEVRGLGRPLAPDRETAVAERAARVEKADEDAAVIAEELAALERVKAPTAQQADRKRHLQERYVEATRNAVGARG